MYWHLLNHNYFIISSCVSALILALFLVLSRKPDVDATIPDDYPKNEKFDLEEKMEIAQSLLATTRYELRKAQEEITWLTAELQLSRDSAVNAARAKSQFLSNMSHEIRTPLNGVIATTQLLLCTSLDDEQRDFLQIAQESATILLETVNDLLDFNLIENGDLSLDVMDFDLVTLVEGAAELVKQKAHEKKLSLMTYVAPNVPTTLYGDPTRLRQVLTNLLSNAIKFTEEGEVVCKVELESMIGSRARLNFSVTDMGPALPESETATLFEPFLQIDENCARENSGTGLGLSIANRLVQLMGSELCIESNEAQGSTLYFNITLDHASRKIESRISQEISGLRLLLIDQMPGTRTIIEEYLRSWGMSCASAANGADGLQMLTDGQASKQPFDIAIIDHQIADIEPLKLARQINNDTTTSNTLLILLRASRYEHSRESVLPTGFCASLTKPIKQSQLYDCIVQVMHNKASAEASANSYKSSVVPQPLELTAPPRTNDQFESPIILVVEDNSVNQRVAKLQLQELGYKVHLVNNGREALYAIMKTRYDLVLMDCAMPVMDGYEATRHIRKHDAISGRHTVIVALTAHALAGDREKCIASGMDDYLSKPVNAQQLQSTIKRWIKQPGATAKKSAH